MNRLSILIPFIALFLFCGCGAKEPKVIYKEVLTPIKCQIKIPFKPPNNGTFESHKALMIYYRECENALRYCLGKENERKNNN